MFVGGWVGRKGWKRYLKNLVTMLQLLILGMLASTEDLHEANSPSRLGRIAFSVFFLTACIQMKYQT